MAGDSLIVPVLDGANTKPTATQAVAVAHEMLLSCTSLVDEELDAGRLWSVHDWPASVETAAIGTGMEVVPVVLPAAKQVVLVGQATAVRDAPEGAVPVAHA